FILFNTVQRHDNKLLFIFYYTQYVPYSLTTKNSRTGGKARSRKGRGLDDEGRQAYLPRSG
ncbi:hypothetical protein, partial [Campylobacter showae]|uniref:hypothetical protein n=1 Tax=Campylobacter showae TaxID=204 RepID=UPI0026EB2ED6